LLLNTASTALAYYKELIAISKRVKEVATQPDKLLNKEDNKEDSTLSNKEALNKDFNPLTYGYISLLSN
jgi:isopentenyl phosphate kinase